MKKNILLVGLLTFIFVCNLFGAISSDEAKDILLGRDKDAVAFGEAERQINDAKTAKESLERYKFLYNSSCLCNKVYNPVHSVINDDESIFPDFAVYDNDVITDWKEDKDIVCYNWKRMYARLGSPVKDGAINNKNITHLLTGPKCSFASKSVINNKKLKFIVIDSEIKNIHEDAFQDNPNIQMYHVCCAYFNFASNKYDLAYDIIQVKGEVDEHIENKSDKGYSAGTLVGGDYRDSYVWKIKPFNEYSEINGVLFDKDKTKLLFYPIGRDSEKYNVPNTVTYIGNSAFRNAKKLRVISIPNSVTEICNDAFFGTNLKFYVKKGSYGEKYAKEHKIKISYMK